jgi:hypothetical protein
LLLQFTDKRPPADSPAVFFGHDLQSFWSFVAINTTEGMVSAWVKIAGTPRHRAH